MDRTVQGRGGFARAASVPAERAGKEDLANGGGAAETSYACGKPAHGTEGEVSDADRVPLFAIPVPASPPEGIWRRDDDGVVRTADGGAGKRSRRAMDPVFAGTWWIVFGGFRGTVSNGGGFSSVGNIAEQEAENEVRIPFSEGYGRFDDSDSGSGSDGD